MNANSDLVHGTFSSGVIHGWKGLFLHYYDRGHGVCERLTIKKR